MQKSGLKTKISLNPNSKGKFRQTPRHSLRSSQPGKMLDALKKGDSRFAFILWLDSKLSIPDIETSSGLIRFFDRFRVSFTELRIFIFIPTV